MARRRNRIGAWLPRIVGCGLVLAASVSVRAQSPEGTLHVGLYENRPKIFTDEDGEAAGFFPELIEIIARNQGWKVDYTRCTFAECLTMVRRGEIDILPDVGYSRERARRMLLSREAVLQTWSTFYSRQGELEARRLEDLDGHRVATLRDSVQHRTLIEKAETLGIDVEILTYETMAAVLSAVSRGDVTFGVVNNYFGRTHAERFALQPSPIVFNPTSLHFAFSPGIPHQTVQSVDTLIALMKSDPQSEYYRLLDTWLKPKDGFSMPDWALGLGGAVAALLLLSLGFNAYLRRVVSERTAALRASQSRLKAIFDNAPVEIYLKDAEGRYIEVNHQFERLFGVEAADIVGLLPFDVHDPGLAERTRAQDLEVLRTGKTTVREEFAETEAGPKVLHTVKFPVFEDDGSVSAIGAIVTDITQQHEARMRMAEVEQRLRDAVAALPAGFCLFDPDDRLVLFNERFVEMLPNCAKAVKIGASYEEIMRAGLDAGEFVAALGREAEWLEERLAERRAGDTEYELEVKGGRWLTSVNRRMSDGGTVGFRLDITELKRQSRAVDGARKRAEAAAHQLREQTRKLAQVVEVTGIGGWELDVEGGTLFWDSITKAMHDVPRWYEPQLDTALSFFTEDSRVEIGEALETCMTRRLPFDKEAEIVTANGRKLWVRVTGRPFIENGRVRRLTGAFQDVTGHKTHEKALQHSWLAAEKANIAKSQFLANMSHEIRTPMNGVTGMLALLLQSNLTERQRLQAQTAHDSASGLMQILNDILDYSKLEANELQIDSVPYDLADVVNEVTAMLSLRAQEKGLALRTDIDPRLPRRLRGDPARVRQVLVNLAGNAIKFTERGEVCIRAHGPRGAHGMISIEVVDTGIGIPDDAQATLFNRFAQADNQVWRRYGGTGLGLAISKQLVEALGGTIGVHSTAGEGSCFWFTLPVEGAQSERAPAHLGTAAQ